MIQIKSLPSEAPYLTFQEKYNEALKAGQKNIEAISISSFNKKTNEVDCRYVNLKFIDEDRFIFFSNYNSPKSISFDTHDQICAAFYWSSTDTQIRMKARIKRTSNDFNNSYFSKRSENKNALAISSNQSNEIASYDDVVNKYNLTKNTKNLSICPNYWGGFCFVPYCFEFWEGHESRLNKRNLFTKFDSKWRHVILEP